MCCHVVAACILGGVACPSVRMRTRQFVRPNHVHQKEQESSSSAGGPSDSDIDDEFVDVCRHSPAESSIGDAADRVQSPYACPATSTASATSTDTVIFEDTAEREVAEDVGESPTMPSPAYVSLLREAPGEPYQDRSTVQQELVEVLVPQHCRT
ncbi:hypothetical protein PC110_g22030 [Phytophthora cactorum]|uniref:Uncharacterized protein n=1 Tax=Phytophthora cactorum TaxID=29920 RepID=A0A329RA13_9STRA|nr:hypothetical protein PC117_g25613 [Phytophthora cactorum]KAG3050548.1 hypothetical protein PC122_g23223 [Phytophthora cactorum]KAG3124736.1 hypothetical protein C6341_g26053 [Phytophthora cactorum]KAG4038564.1 hypothetical protein PC123_g25873 [Phytophthora cactorum]RAW21527.1 hypothetical protein PC110_g22030 [Phytophthora cactorum]